MNIHPASALTRISVFIRVSIFLLYLFERNSANYAQLLDNAKKLVNRVKDARGILVLDWHQRTMYNADYPGWAEVFFDLIDYARNEGAYFISPGETARLLKSKMAVND